VALSALTLAGCSGLRTPPPKDPDALAEYKQANDPYEPLNRKIYNVTMTFDKWAFAPGCQSVCLVRAAPCA
jgi:phospholipid-binding lipoprotein MlaA